MTVSAEQVIQELIKGLSPMFDVHAIYDGKEITPKGIKPIKREAPTKKPEPKKVEQKPQLKPRSFLDFPKAVKVEFKEKIEDTANGVVNNTVTIVYFEDGTNTIVKRNKNDEDNRDAAVAFAILKRLFATSYDPKTGTAICKNLFDIVHSLVKQANYDYKYIGTDMVSKAVKIPPKVFPSIPGKSNNPPRDARGRFIKKV